jgi:hypothetical protein
VSHSKNSPFLFFTQFTLRFTSLIGIDKARCMTKEPVCNVCTQHTNFSVKLGLCLSLGIVKDLALCTIMIQDAYLKYPVTLHVCIMKVKGIGFKLKFSS